MPIAEIPAPVEYLVREDGQRTGVVLRWEDYQKLRALFSPDSDLLTDLSESELQTLADGLLAPRYQHRLDALLQRNRQGRLTPAEDRELDHLLTRVDELNILKARAMHTLQKLGGG